MSGLFSKPKVPDVPAPPPPVPNIADASAAERTRRTTKLKRGFASTLLSSGAGQATGGATPTQLAGVPLNGSNKSLLGG